MDRSSGRCLHQRPWIKFWRRGEAKLIGVIKLVFSINIIQNNVSSKYFQLGRFLFQTNTKNILQSTQLIPLKYFHYVLTTSTLIWKRCWDTTPNKSLTACKPIHRWPTRPDDATPLCSPLNNYCLQDFKERHMHSRPNQCVLLWQEHVTAFVFASASTLIRLTQLLIRLIRQHVVFQTMFVLVLYSFLCKPLLNKSSTTHCTFFFLIGCSNKVFDVFS